MTDAATTDQAQQEKKPPIVKVGGREVDLRRAFPLTIRDWQELKKVGINIATLRPADIDADVLAAIAVLVVRKADPEVSPDAVLDLPAAVVFRIGEAATEVGDTDLPF